MRKPLVALGLALVAVMTLTAPALAWGGDTDVDVDISDIVVDPFNDYGTYLLGTTLHISGNVNITSNSEVKGLLTLAYAESEGWYTITDPGGGTVSNGSSTTWDLDAGLKKANADAGQTYTWNYDLLLNETGDWTVQQGGDALALYLALIGGAGCDSESEANLITLIATNAPQFGSIDSGGQFVCHMFGCGRGYYQAYHWVEDWQKGMTLAEPVSQCGDFYFYGQHDVYKIEIPAGTVITDYYGHYTNYFRLDIVCGEPVFTPNLKFSQPVTLYKLVDGEWVEVLKFTQVLDGKAS